MSHAPLRSPVLALLLAASACSQPRAAQPAEACRLDVIARLTVAPDSALLADLTRRAEADVALTRPMAAGLSLLTITAAGDAAACAAALERLREDARVVSADPDSRRAPQEP
jgi:hypothetical protein